MRLEHLVFSRFGVGIFDRVWLRHRLLLSKGMMLSSLRRQKERRFALRIQVDQELPAEFKEELGRELRGFCDACLRPIRLHALRRQDSLSCAREHIAETGAEVVVVTRIDDDDALSTGAVRAIQRAAGKCARDGDLPAVISFEGGVKFVPGRGLVRPHIDPNLGVGMSLVFRAAEPVSIYDYGHNVLRGKGLELGWKIVTLGSEEGQWCYAIHKFSDRDYLSRLGGIVGRKGTVDAREGAMADFGLEWGALEEWREFDRDVEPLGSVVTSLAIGELEKRILRLERRRREGVRDEVLEEEIARMYCERRVLGSRVTEELRARGD